MPEKKVEDTDSRIGRRVTRFGVVGTIDRICTCPRLIDPLRRTIPHAHVKWDNGGSGCNLFEDLGGA